MDYFIDRKKQKIFFLIAVIAIVALLAGAVIRTNVFNNTERTITLVGEEINNLPDYSGLEVSNSKTPGGWSIDIDGRTFDAYTLNVAISNSTGEELSDYRVRYNVNDDVYFITAWCGTIEFHQTSSDGSMVCQTIDLRNRPDIYLVDTVQTDDAPIIPLHKGDWFVYIPSSSEGEAPLADGTAVTPGIMYYEAQGREEEVFTFVPSEKSENSLNGNDVSITLTARNNTWTKIFDLENTGSQTPDYQAYTYDLTILNNTDAVLSDYTFNLSFGTDAYMASAWNGSLTVNQGTVSDFIKDLRDFDPAELCIETVNVDGENFVYLGAEDFIVYTPAATGANPDIPVKPGEASVPGFIVYMKIGDTTSNAKLTLSYKLNKSVVSDPLFDAAAVVAVITGILGAIYIATAYQRKRFEQIHQHDKMIINESIETFTGFIDAKDPYTNGHSHRVAQYTKLIAEKLGYKDEELDRIYYIALLHDCGKIGVADSILGKPDKLTSEEFNEIKKHTTLGGEILKNFKSIDGVTEGAMYHHERYDGNGYPEGRKGTDIPQIGRIICVADSFDAMNSDRCYRKKLSRETIISEIETNKGRQFDPDIADIMLSLIENGDITI